MSRVLPRPPEPFANEDEARAPLWRGAQMFRALSVLYAVGVHVAHADRFEHIGWSWVLLAGVVLESAFAAFAYIRGFGRNLEFVAVEAVATGGLVLATWLVAPSGFAQGNQSLPTTLWMTNVVVSVAILCGPVGGVVAGIAMAALNAVYRGTAFGGTLTDANYPVMIALGLGLGVSARVAVRSVEAVREAERVAGEARARERLARQVHDGVLQTLALVARRGGEWGVDGAALARAAAEQEQALRRLIAETPSTGPVQVAAPAAGGSPVAGGAPVDVRLALRPLAGPGVTLSEPGGPVLLGADAAAELAAAVRNALDNTARHAGPGAQSFVLVEDLGDEIVVTVRDDGRGIRDGRLAAARAEGRLGVSESIVGRMRALGGRADLVTGPGQGVEWELTVPRGTPGEDA